MKLFKSKRQKQLESISNTLCEIDEGVADLQSNLDDMQILAKECLVICNRIIEQLER